MNLETQIKPELWSAISDSYKSENYTHAIKDAMSLITEILRDKSGLDGDGDKLVGQALGFSEGKEPRIKINKFQTQTEQDIHKGLMYLLKGMYALVRNPRTHERSLDSKNTTDTIILFIDYLLGFLGSSQQSFTVEDFLSMVTDRHFVHDKEYVQGIVDQIPARKRADTVIALYREKNWKQSDNFTLVIKEIVYRLNDSEVADLLSVVSDDLMQVDKAGSATLVIKILPEDIWPRIDRMPRLRIENMLLEELNPAQYIPETDSTENAAATWINRIAKYYLRKDQLRSTIIKKLKAVDFDHQNFIAKYFIRFNVLPDIFENDAQIKGCIGSIAASVKAGNAYMKNSLLSWMSRSSPGNWDDGFVKSLESLTDQDNPEQLLPDGRPFLGKFVPSPNPALNTFDESSFD